ncbi:MAG TPA: glycosyltransferase [Steroidobacteraceae bacterium]|nr:glycosyltransferase [Steroidobacteraceae bacterium]
MIVFGSPLNGGARQAPAVSVVMAVYNAEDFLAEAIESVLGQTLTDFELLLVDDASTDGSPVIVERYARADRRIRAFRLARNGGTAHARNAALAHARAPLVAICDDDDRQRPQRLALQAAWLDAPPRCVMVGGRVRPFGDADAAALAWLPGDDALARPHVLFQALYVDSASLFRRDLARVHGLRYPSGPVWEDWVFQALALRVGEIHVLPETLLDYRRHAAQQTSPARLMASGRRTRASMQRVLEIAGVTCTRAELELHHAISPSPFGVVPDRDYLLRHGDRLDADAGAWLARLGRQAVRAGWTEEAAYRQVAEAIRRHLRQGLAAMHAAHVQGEADCSVRPGPCQLPRPGPRS